MNILIADMIWFVSGTMITFSQGGAAKIESKQFSEFGSQTKQGAYFLVHLIELCYICWHL